MTITINKETFKNVINGYRKVGNFVIDTTAETLKFTYVEVPAFVATLLVDGTADIVNDVMNLFGIKDADEMTEEEIEAIKKQVC